MSRYKQNNQGQSGPSNPALFWFSYKPKSKVLETENGPQIVPPHFLVYHNSELIQLQEITFITGSEIYRAEGFSRTGNNPASGFFLSPDAPVKWFGVGQSTPVMSYKEAKKTPLWGECEFKFFVYVWGVARFVHPETGEQITGPAMLGLTSGFNEYREGDEGQVRTLKAGAGQKVEKDGNKFVLFGASDASDSEEMETAFNAVSPQFVRYFRRFVPDYLAQYFDENGNPNA